MYSICLSVGSSLANTSMHMFIYVVDYAIKSQLEAPSPGKASMTLSTGGPGATRTNGSASKRLNLPGFRCSEAGIFRRMPSPEQEQGLMLRSFRR